MGRTGWVVGFAAAAALGGALLTAQASAKPSKTVIHAVCEGRDAQGEVRLVVLGSRLEGFSTFELVGSLAPIGFARSPDSSKSVLVLVKEELGVVEPGDYQLVMSGRSDAIVGVRINGRLANGSIVEEQISSALRDELDDASTLGGRAPEEFLGTDGGVLSGSLEVSSPAGAALAALTADPAGAGVVAESASAELGAVALETRLPDAAAGDLARFRTGADVRARIDAVGAGYFDGGTQTGGADFAESVAVDRPREDFAPGDVVVVATDADRTFALSAAPDSPLVAGVVSTKPGVLAMPRDPSGCDLSWREREVPLAVTGIVPTKVCDEGGAIARGDLLVTASVAGHAKRAGPDPRPGTVLGKALGRLESGRGTIEVLLAAR
jgi:hypothetical protein